MTCIIITLFRLVSSSGQAGFFMAGVLPAPLRAAASGVENRSRRFFMAGVLPAPLRAAASGVENRSRRFFMAGVLRGTGMRGRPPQRNFLRHGVNGLNSEFVFNISRLNIKAAHKSEGGY
ncbi:hypothetical protein DDT56_00955 [Brenneria corticis]|uniref:Secreted protein n=1 Tax=Brenneria corticis TaxID=2173106 RepID=A0A2U1UDC7_9GAMM|nr:hypothetical protein DDT56_00955 [Brenneria sp. CFCC 11842]